MGIDIKGDLCAFMPSKILDGFDIYAPEQQVCDVCVAKDMRGHLMVRPCRSPLRAVCVEAAASDRDGRKWTLCGLVIL